MMRTLLAAAALGAVAMASGTGAQTPAVPQGPVGPSPYTLFAVGTSRLPRRDSPSVEIRACSPNHPTASSSPSAASSGCRIRSPGVRRLRRLDRAQRPHRRRSPRLAELPLHSRPQRQASRSDGRSGTSSARGRLVPGLIASVSAHTIASTASGSSTRPSTRSTSSRTTASSC